MKSDLKGFLDSLYNCKTMEDLTDIYNRDSKNFGLIEKKLVFDSVASICSSEQQKKYFVYGVKYRNDEEIMKLVPSFGLDILCDYLFERTRINYNVILEFAINSTYNYEDKIKVILFILSNYMCDLKKVIKTGMDLAYDYGNEETVNNFVFEVISRKIDNTPMSFIEAYYRNHNNYIEFRNIIGAVINDGTPYNDTVAYYLRCYASDKLVSKFVKNLKNISFSLIKELCEDLVLSSASSNDLVIFARNVTDSNKKLIFETLVKRNTNSKYFYFLGLCNGAPTDEIIDLLIERRDTSVLIDLLVNLRTALPEKAIKYFKDNNMKEIIYTVNHANRLRKENTNPKTM